MIVEIEGFYLTYFIDVSKVEAVTKETIGDNTFCTVQMPNGVVYAKGSAESVVAKLKDAGWGAARLIPTVEPMKAYEYGISKKSVDIRFQMNPPILQPPAPDGTGRPHVTPPPTTC